MVVPLSVLFNWVAECKKFAPTLRVLRVHSNDAGEAADLKAKLLTIADYDIILTTYEMLKTGRLQNSLHRIHYRSVILDEGHRIKNNETLTSKG